MSTLSLKPEIFLLRRPINYQFLTRASTHPFKYFFQTHFLNITVYISLNLGQTISLRMPHWFMISSKQASKSVKPHLLTAGTVGSIQLAGSKRGRRQWNNMFKKCADVRTAVHLGAG